MQLKNLAKLIITVTGALMLTACAPKYNQHTNVTKQSQQKKNNIKKKTKAELKAEKKREEKDILKNSLKYHYLTMPQAFILFDKQQTFSGIAVDPDTRAEYYVSGSVTNDNGNYSQTIAPRLDNSGRPTKYKGSIKALALGKEKKN